MTDHPHSTTAYEAGENAYLLLQSEAGPNLFEKSGY